MSAPVDVLAVTIQPTDYGKFFIKASDDRVWRGDEWVAFGPAELYRDYPSAMRAFREASTRVKGGAA